MSQYRRERFLDRSTNTASQSGASHRRSRAVSRRRTRSANANPACAAIRCSSGASGPAGMIGALLLVQPAGSVALSYAFLGERPSILQLAGVVLVLAGVVAAVNGAGPAGSEAPSSRRSTRIIRQASAAPTGVPSSKSP